MKTLTESAELEPLVLHMRPAVEMTDDQFFEFCRQNKDLNIERSANGEIVIMAPTGFESSVHNDEVFLQLRAWAEKDGSGVACGPSAGFVLPNHAVRAPDASWIQRTRLEAFTADQKKRFLPLCPDFVVEVRSPSDSLSMLMEKMEEYTANGARLEWLIDTANRQVYVYRPGVSVERLANPSTVSGDPVLPGFRLDFRRILGSGR